MEVIVIFLGAENEGNIGSLARVMKNFGLYKLILVSPKAKIGDEALKSAMHAQDVLKSAKILNSFDKAIEDVDFVIGTTARLGWNYNVLRTPIFPDQLSILRKRDGKIAIVFGRESNGLTNEELNKCDVVLTIPANPEYPTLNITHAAAIIFYELFKILGKSMTERYRCATKVEKDKILEVFSKLLEEIDYPSEKLQIIFRVFRNVVGRAFISGREAHTFIGVLRRTVTLIKRLKQRKRDK
ncbi:MAG: RNA methyltransferase [Candidatus Baldrarchaeia archaeon]